MSKSRRQTDDFKALQAEWYAKLKDDGFEDIEKDEDTLKVWINNYFPCRYSLSQIEAKQEYYRVASQFLYEHKFKSALEKKIWELHANGVSVRGIVAELKNIRSHQAVQNKIKAVRQIMADKCFKRKT